MDEQCQQLLLQLKTTVEGLLGSQVSSVWHVYGGLNRLHNVVCKIFKHGCNTLDQEGEPDCWGFIQGLIWLQPSLAASPAFATRGGSRDKAATWLYKSLESHSLSHPLSRLLSDRTHLLSCYQPSAFLCQPRYSEAALVCLCAVEQGQLSLLTDIDPSLFLSKWKVHRRCSSFPDAMPRSPKPRTALPLADTELASLTLPSTTIQIPATLVTSAESTLTELRPIIHRGWASLPSLPHTAELTNSGLPKSAPVSRRPCTLPSSPAIHAQTRSNTHTHSHEALSPSLLHIDYKQLQQGDNPPSKCKELIVLKDVTKSAPIIIKPSVRRNLDLNMTITSSNGSSDLAKSKSASIHHISNSIYEETDSSCMDSSFKSFQRRVRLKSSGVRCGIKSHRRKSFMESGGNSVQPMSTGFFPRPVEGQSLASFLSSGQFAGTKAELDRENAHFAISEAMIAAIEQVKFNMWTKAAEDVIEESDEEINRLKQRIRLRRHQRQQEQRRTTNTVTHTHSLLSDGKTDTTTTDSISPLSSSVGGSSDTDSLSTDGVDDLEIDDNTSTNLNQLSESGLSVSLASLFSEAELSRPAPSELSASFTAESVALALLRRFSDKQLPRASDIQWLVTEQEACGQRLLPLPTSWPVDQDQAEDQDMRDATPLRGTTDWAPPRPQIIFTVHPAANWRVSLARQSYRCAGCGLTVAQRLAHKYRYCSYLGRYFCTGCHSNQQALIPAHIIHNWDFTTCGVSNFSYRLLDQMASDPLFNLHDLNAALYSRVRALDKTRVYRTQLHFLKDFLNICRFANEQEDDLREFLSSAPPYLLEEPHVYSIQDLMQVKTGQLPDRLQDLVLAGISHVDNCVLCQGRGFVCEVCKASDVVFPWQLTRVHRCSACGNCFHQTCHTPQTPCGRCHRLNTRRKNSMMAGD